MTFKNYFYSSDLYEDEPNTCVEQPEWNVEQTSAGYEITIENLPMFYYKFIIGAKGSKKREIESSSNVSIGLPQKGQQGNVSKFISFTYFSLNTKLINIFFFFFYVMPVYCKEY